MEEENNNIEVNFKQSNIKKYRLEKEDFLMKLISERI